PGARRGRGRGSLPRPRRARGARRNRDDQQRRRQGTSPPATSPRTRSHQEHPPTCHTRPSVLPKLHGRDASLSGVCGARLLGVPVVLAQEIAASTTATTTPATTTSRTYLARN